jgi:hypothetical protein
MRRRARRVCDRGCDLDAAFMDGARDLEILARAPNFVLRRS